MERRKDDKGRVLKEGESQRKDGRYQYRWTDDFGKRHTVYADDLKELRIKKESKAFSTNSDKSEITVYSLVVRYEKIHKKSLRESSSYTRGQFIRKIENSYFGEKSISDVTTLKAKEWFVSLNEEGMSQAAISNMKNILTPAFQMAVDECLIPYNPFSFCLNKLIKPNKKKKVLMTEDQYKNLIDFAKTNKTYSKYIDLIVVLHETGIRVSELCGLTIDDVDLENGFLKITHQLGSIPGKKEYIQEPKSKSGFRTIPLTKAAKNSFQSIINRRLLMERGPIIDGYSYFLFLRKDSLRPKNRDAIDSIIEGTVKSYNKKHEEKIPPTTPHSFRHMFCTRLISAGMNVKSVQYLMGHSNIRMTLDVYAEFDIPLTTDEFLRIADS